MTNPFPSSLIALLHRTLLVVVALLSAGVGQADVFMLHSGGQIAGKWLNRDDSLQAPYQVQTAAGLTLQVDRQSVERVITERDDEMAYEALAPKVADTIEQQWKLAEWCRERHLTDERQVHLQRILAIDPDHLPARRALGYSQVSGQWYTREQLRRKRGFENYRGRWRLPQEIDILEERHKQNLAEKQWLVRIRNWREMLLTEDAAKARDQLLAIKDPQAVSTLTDFLLNDPMRIAKLIYINTLMNIGDAASVQALVAASLGDPDEEVRYACLDAIEQLEPPGVVPVYVRALGHTNNFVVNRAAFALGRLGDDSVAATLINALTTTHTFTYQTRPAASADTITTSFVNEGRAKAAGAPPLMPSTGTNLAMGDGKKSITRRIPNAEVLTALLKLTGGPNYGYDQQAWRSWLESQIQSSPVDARRQ